MNRSLRNIRRRTYLRGPGQRHTLFPYVLADNAFPIELSSPGRKVPMAYAQVSSTYLAHVGSKQTQKELRAVLDEIGEAARSARTSVASTLFVDFVCTCRTDRTAGRNEAWVTRAGYIHAAILMGGALYRLDRSAWAASSVVAPVQQDPGDPEESARTTSWALWQQVGLEPWRNAGLAAWSSSSEREVLTARELGEAVSTVLSHLNGLWELRLTTEWLRGWRLPNPDDQTRSRWPIHPLWRLPVLD